MTDLLSSPLPWYAAGALIGLVVPALLVIGGRRFALSANLRHLCAISGARLPLFRYDWRREGGWNLTFAAGLVLGGFLAQALPGTTPVADHISATTVRDVTALGITNLDGAAPAELVSWSALATRRGWVTLVLGGLLVGFGARWAGGCTSGHAISGLAAGQASSLLAVVGFFAGGLLMTHVLLPWLL